MAWSEPQKHHEGLCKVVRCLGCKHVFVWSYYVAAKACPRCPARGATETIKRADNQTWFKRKEAIAFAKRVRDNS